MGSRDHLERNIERLLRAVQPELELPGDKKEEILANLVTEAEVLSSKDSAASSRRPVILRRWPILAAVAVLMIGILAGAAWLSRYIGIEQTDQFATQPKGVIEETITDEKKADDKLIVEDMESQKAQIQARLRQVEAMFNTGNIKGLTTMFSDKASEVRIAAANYLARIGDFDSVKPLLDASKEWTGPEQDNPFVNAIYQIMLRISRQQAQITVEKQQQEPNEPSEDVSPTLIAKEPPKPDKKTATFSGVVSNEAGEPLEGVHVRSISYDEYIEFSGTEAEGDTDENGLFAVGPIDAQDLDKVNRVLIFEHPEYAIGWFHTKPGGRMMRHDEIEISLLSPSVVSGIVIDEQGDPIEGAVVEASLQLQLQPDEGYYYLTMSETYGMALITDFEGRFAFEKIPDKARLHLVVRSAGYAPYSTRIEYAATDDFPIRAGRDDLAITLRPGGFIRGRLVMNGKPYEKEGVSILVQGEKSHLVSQTDRAGQFETTGLAQGGYSVKALEDEFEKEGLASRMLTDVWVVVGLEPTEVELTLSSSINIIVKVVDEQTGKPAKDVRVTAALQDAENATAAYSKTDVEGRSILQVSAGEYVLKAQGWKYGKPHDFSENVTVSSSDKDLTVTIAVTPRFIISGLLIDAGARPVAGTVSIGSDSTTAGIDGKFDFPQPEGDRMQVHVGFAFDETGRIGQAFYWQKNADTNDLVIILEPVAIITGRVVLEDGTPVDQAEPKLWTRMPTGGWRSGSSNNPWKLNIIGNGEFEFENVPIGLEMDVHVKTQGSEGMAKIDSIFPGETIDVGDIVLKAMPEFEDIQNVVDSNDLDIQTTYDANTVTAQ